MKVRLPPITGKITPEKRWILDGSRVLVDAVFAPKPIGRFLDILPLLTDKVIVYDPSVRNLRSWGFDEGRFRSLVDERIFIPLFAHSPSDFEPNDCITRKDLLPDSEFWGEYDSSISSDLEDDNLLTAISRVATVSQQTSGDLVFSLNWDVLISQILSSPIVAADRFENVWAYKFDKTIQDLSELSGRRVAAGGGALHKFLYRAIKKLPSELTVNDLKRLREERAARRFREWFSGALDRAMTTKKVTQVKPDEAIYMDFIDLAEKANKGINKAAEIAGVSISGAVGLFSTAMGYPAAGVGGTIGSTVVLPRLIKKVWGRFSPDNWVFVLMSLRRT